jgi:hypothetical protein
MRKLIFDAASPVNKIVAMQLNNQVWADEPVIGGFPAERLNLPLS